MTNTLRTIAILVTCFLLTSTLFAQRQSSPPGTFSLDLVVQSYNTPFFESEIIASGRLDMSVTRYPAIEGMEALDVIVSWDGTDPAAHSYYKFRLSKKEAEALAHALLKLSNR